MTIVHCMCTQRNTRRVSMSVNEEVWMSMSLLISTPSRNFRVSMETMVPYHEPNKEPLLWFTATAMRMKIAFWVVRRVSKAKVKFVLRMQSCRLRFTEDLGSFCSDHSMCQKIILTVIYWTTIGPIHWVLLFCIKVPAWLFGAFQQWFVVWRVCQDGDGSHPNRLNRWQKR